MFPSLLLHQFSFMFGSHPLGTQHGYKIPHVYVDFTEKGGERKDKTVDVTDKTLGLYDKDEKKQAEN